MTPLRSVHDRAVCPLHVVWERRTSPPNIGVAIAASRICQGSAPRFRGGNARGGYRFPRNPRPRLARHAVQPAMPLHASGRSPQPAGDVSLWRRLADVRSLVDPWCMSWSPRRRPEGERRRVPPSAAFPSLPGEAGRAQTSNRGGVRGLHGRPSSRCLPPEPVTCPFAPPEGRVGLEGGHGSVQEAVDDAPGQATLEGGAFARGSPRSPLALRPGR